MTAKEKAIQGDPTREEIEQFVEWIIRHDIEYNNWVWGEVYEEKFKEIAIEAIEWYKKRTEKLNE
jgi:hypothetical protein